MAKRSIFMISMALLAILFGNVAQAQTGATPTPTVAVEEQEPETDDLELEELEAKELEEEDVQVQESDVEAAQAANGLEITVYNQNIGLVKEIRTLELEAGANEVRFTDVPTAIDATSVHFQSLTAPDETVVLEQNYEYDIVGSQKLLNKYVDREITLTTEQGNVYTGTLLSAADDIILATEDGIKIVRTGQVLEYAFPALPEGLITRPTLVWLLQAAQAGAQDVRVTYLTKGINWQADYVALLAADDKDLSLTGWVTVENHSGAAYQDAKLKLVAGDVNVLPEAKQMVYAMEDARAMPTAAPQVEERSFFEYHLYEVQRPVTIKDRQTKQIEFTSAPEVAVEKVFVLPGGSYRWWGNVFSDASYHNAGSTNAQVQVRFVNDQESGLGIPLPEGRIRVYQEDIDGGAEFIGEDRIDHTPRDEKVSLYLGNAFDVIGERTQVEFIQVSRREVRETIEVELRNHKDEDIEVHLVEELYRAQDATVVEASAEYTQVDANTIEFVVPVAADGEAVVTYTVDYRW